MNKFKIILSVVLVVFVCIFIRNCITVVETGEIGLKVRLGQVVGEPLQAGIHGKIPFVESIKIFDAKVQKE